MFPLLRPSYLYDLCCPVSVVAAHWVLCSAARGKLLVPRARLAIMQLRAFSVVGPSAWNDLPVELRSLLMIQVSNLIELYKERANFLPCFQPVRRLLAPQNPWVPKSTLWEMLS